MGLSRNLALDMYTKLAHFAFHRRMKRGLKWMNIISESQGRKPHDLVSHPNSKKDKYGRFLMTEGDAKRCGTALAEKCLKDGIVNFGVLDTPRGLDVCISTGEGSSLRGLAQYRITHDDYIYRFDLRGYSK
jgi:hypothetical protein